MLWKNSSSEKVSAMKVRSFAKVASLKKQFFRKGRWCRILLCRKLSFFRKRSYSENVGCCAEVPASKNHLFNRYPCSEHGHVLVMNNFFHQKSSCPKKYLSLRSSCSIGVLLWKSSYSEQIIAVKKWLSEKVTLKKWLSESNCYVVADILKKWLLGGSAYCEEVASLKIKLSLKSRYICKKENRRLQTKIPN